MESAAESKTGPGLFGLAGFVVKPTRTFSFSIPFNYYFVPVGVVAGAAAGLILAYSLINASQQKVYDVYSQNLIGKQLI